MDSPLHTPDEHCWKILVADDDREMHAVTQLVLSELEFDGKSLNLLYASGEKEARALLVQHSNIALAILDVVMDTGTSGLDLVRYIRDELGNRFTRLILRTGQPGHAPESRVVIEYDINDYKDKTELTSQKLKTSVISALRSYRDIVSLGQSKRQLAETEDFLASVISSISSAFIVIDGNCLVTEYNPHASELFGGTRAQVIGRHVYDVVPELKTRDRELSASIGNGVISVQLDFCTSHAPERVYSLSIYPYVRDSLSNGAILLMDDVTEKRRMDEQLRRSQKLEALGCLSAGIAHDVNNALGGIMGSVSLIDFEKNEHPENHNPVYDEYLDTIRHSTERASAMVSQLLNLSRKDEHTREQVDLVKVLGNVIRICSNSFDKRIGIIENLKVDKAHILCDPARLEQVFLNLCINAYHAMTIMRPDSSRWEGSISIGLSSMKKKGEDYYRVSVKDTGVGMESANLDRIFDPFYTTKAHGEGTGLGLAVVHNSVSSCGGTIDVFSTPGEGTEFIVCFPSCKGEYADVEVHADPEIPTGTGTILVCDDEIFMRSIATKILTKTGYNVITADDGAEAVDIFSQFRDIIDLVIIDWQMPRLSGIEVSRKIREIRPDVKVLLSSGFRGQGQIEEARSIGITGFLQKPYTMMELADIVRRTLREDVR